MYDQSQRDVNCDRNNVMDLSDYLKAFRERWLLILVCTIVGGGLAGILTERIPPTYTGESTLFLKVESTAGSLYERSQFGLQRVKSYPSVVQSPDVLVPVIAELKLDITLADLQSRVSATNPTNTFFLKVQVEDSSPERAAAIANAVSKNLASAVAILETSKGESTSAVSLVQTVPASPPSGKTSPSLMLNGVLGLLIGLALGLAAAVSRKRFGRRVRTAEDVRTATDLPLLGSLGRGPIRKTFWRYRKAPVDSEGTANKELRNNLQLVAGGRLPNMLVLATGSAGYNDADLRHELAASLAHTGRLVCLVEADFPTGSGQDGDEGPDIRGVADVLSGNCDMAEALVASADGLYQVLPAGSRTSAPSEFLAQKRFPAVAKKLRDDFDVVLAQASRTSQPINLAMMASSADGVVLVVEHAKTRKRDLARLLAEVKACGLRPLGVVMTSVPTARRVPVSGGWRSGDFRDADLQLELQRVHEYR